MSYKLVYKSLTENQRQEIGDILTKYDNSELNILNTLLEIQDSVDEKYIGEEVCEIVSERTGIPMIELYDIMSFYSMLDTEPRAKYKIEVCDCGSCYLNDSQSLIEILEEKLRIKVGEHTYDWLFELETGPCVGACDIGPVMKIGDTVYGNLDKEKISEILDMLHNNRNEVM